MKKICILLMFALIGCGPTTAYKGSDVYKLGSTAYLKDGLYVDNHGNRITGKIQENTGKERIIWTVVEGLHESAEIRDGSGAIVSRKFYRDGDLIREETYRMNLLFERFIYSNGAITEKWLYNYLQSQITSLLLRNDEAYALKIYNLDMLLLQETITDENGKRHTTGYTYNKDKTLNSSITAYSEGIGEVKRYQNGTLVSVIRTENLKQHGETVTYYPNGQIEKISQYYEGKQHGPAKTYRKDGSLESEGNFVDGMMDGKFTIYYADGNIMVSIIYEADQMRYYEIYRKNGQLWHELNYQDELVVSGTCHTSDGKVRDLTEAEVDNWNNKIPVDCQ